MQVVGSPLQYFLVCLLTSMSEVELATVQPWLPALGTQTIEGHRMRDGRTSKGLGHRFLMDSALS